MVPFLLPEQVTAPNDNDPSPTMLDLGFGAYQTECTVLEVVVVEGQGTIIIVSLGSEVLHVGDELVLAGKEGAILVKIQALIASDPGEELALKGKLNDEDELKRNAEEGKRFRITGEGLQNVISGKQFYVVRDNDNVEDLKRSVMKQDI